MGQRLRKLRTDRHLTLSQLEARLAELGHPLQLSVLSKIEKGQRRIDVDDIVALGLALDVSPNMILLPDGARASSTVQLTSTRAMTEEEAWAWVTRDKPVREPGSELSVRSVGDLERGVALTARTETARLPADALGLEETDRIEAVTQGRSPVTASFPVTFGTLLRERRARAGLTQEELAAAAGLSVRSVSDLERGVASTARKETARLLAEALGLAGAARAEFEAIARGRAPATVPSVPGASSVGHACRGRHAFRARRG